MRPRLVDPVDGGRRGGGAGRMGRTARLAAALALAGAAGAACSRGADPDAYGNVEATEVVVGAEASGQLLWFAPTEGMRLPADTLVGVIDTTELALQREQLAAQRAGGASRVTEVARQIDVLEVQRDVARRTYERTRRLFAQQAATAYQLDQAEREYRVLDEQIGAARAQRRTAGQDVAATEARAAQVRQQIENGHVRNPAPGTVLATYARAGEFVQTGQPLYRIANLDTVDVRAYVTEPQLAELRIGQRAEVAADAAGGERRALPGTVTWVSSQAEFTPTPIQTREERADLVYAIKVRVSNAGGVLKIGMPVDVRLARGGVAAR
ncbi:MAG: HlyD family secretion protein [Gemmatimonadaceae bacterium]